MTSQPQVCICIPTYNCAPSIGQTLDSLLSQTYKSYIIKIFDNASTDNTVDILKLYAKKNSSIQLYQNETNIGGEANFTRCIQSGEGKYTAVYHADDIYSATMVEEQVAVLESQPCVAVFTHAKIIDAQGKLTGERLIPSELNINRTTKLDLKAFFKLILKWGNFITCPSAMVRTEIYNNKIVTWDGTNYKTSADLDVWLRLLKEGEICFIPKPLMNYRHSTVSYSYNLARMRTHQHDLFLVLNEYMSRSDTRKFLNSSDYDNYNFLVFKDNVNRTINSIIQSKGSLDLPIPVFSISILKSLFSSENKLKFYMAGLAVKVLLIFPLPEVMKKYLYRFRFGA